MQLWRSLRLTAAHERMIFARLKGGRARGDAAASALGMLAGTWRALPCVRSGLAGDTAVLPRSACGGCDVGDCARTDGAPLGADHVAAEPAVCRTFLNRSLRNKPWRIRQRRIYIPAVPANLALFHSAISDLCSTQAICDV